jgi:hypothetical protein
MAQKKSQYSWQYNKMMALVRAHDFYETDDYFQYILSSKINGQINQCCSLFKKMPKEYRKEFLSYLADQIFSDGRDRESFELLKLLIEEI